MKERTQRYTIARLRHHVAPLIGHKRLTEIMPGDIERFVRDVAAGKTARDEKAGPRKRIIVRGGPVRHGELSATFRLSSELSESRRQTRERLIKRTGRSQT
jgi:hypothetical protein